MKVIIKGYPISFMKFIKCVSLVSDMTLWECKRWCEEFEKNAPTDGFVWGTTGQSVKPNLDDVRKFSKHAKDNISKEIDIKTGEVSVSDFKLSLEEIGMIVITNREKNLKILFDDNKDS